MTTSTASELTRRTPAAECFYNIKPQDMTWFCERRPVIIGRNNPREPGISLEYSHTGGRNWHILSTHESIHQAIDAFHNLPLGKDTDPRHYRILKEG